MKLKLLLGASLLAATMNANALLAVRICPNLQEAKAQYSSALKTYNKEALRQLMIWYISCGLDPTKIVPPAAFGGFGGFPDVTTVPQSLGGDPVSPS